MNTKNCLSHWCCKSWSGSRLNTWKWLMHLSALNSFHRCRILSSCQLLFWQISFHLHYHICVISTTASNHEVVMLPSLTGREICLQQSFILISKQMFGANFSIIIPGESGRRWIVILKKSYLSKCNRVHVTRYYPPLLTSAIYSEG